MAFTTQYSYSLPRGKCVSEIVSKPLGTLQEFKDKINNVIENFGNKPNFKFNGSFG